MRQKVHGYHFFIKQKLISSDTIEIYNTTVKQSLKMVNSPFLTILTTEIE